MYQNYSHYPIKKELLSTKSSFLFSKPQLGDSHGLVWHQY